MNGKENKDFAGVAVRTDAILLMVLDGLSSSVNSSSYVRKIATSLTDWFVSTEESINEDVLIRKLRETHSCVCAQFKKEAASYVLAIYRKRSSLLVLHTGDCLLGFQKTQDISWCIRPHTLANAVEDLAIEQIIASPLRNRLTQCFKVGEFTVPEVTRIESLEKQTIILATDGFWADFSPQQKNSVLSNETELSKYKPQDDCSILTIKVSHSSAEEIKLRTTGSNIVIK